MRHIYGPIKAIALGSLKEPEQLLKCPQLLLLVCGLVIQLQNTFSFHLNLLFSLGGGSLLVESASIKSQHRAQEVPAQGAPEKTSCREQKGVEDGRLRLSYSCHNPEGRDMMLYPTLGSGESNDKYVCVLVCAPVC